MEEGNRPCKRKRTNPGEENSSDSYENLEYNRDRHRSKSASFRLESPQSCDCDKNRLNCNQNCSVPSASVILSPSNCNNCNQVKCNLYQTDQICNCNQSYSKCDTNVMCNDSCTSKGQYSGGISSSQSTYKIPCIARVPQDVPKILSTDRQTLAKSSLEELKLSVEQCTPKVSTSVEIGLKDGQNNKEANTALQGSSKVDTSGSSKTSENFAAPETSCQTISDPKLPVDPLMNSGLPFDPLVNLCSCSSSSSSPSRGEGSYQICNPGFEVLCSPGEKNSQKSNADPECGEDMGDGEKEGEERKTSGEGKNALICERSAVTDLISSRRATKFRIQKSLGQSSENIRKFSWNSNGEKDESADMDAHLSDSESENKANCRPTHEKPERAVYNAFRARFTSENLVNKEAYSNLTSVAHINKLPASILVNILRHLRMCDLLHRASLVCKLWHQLVYDPDLWRKIDLRYQHKVTDEQLVTLTQISDRVTHIDISDTQNLTSEAVDVALKWCSHLRSLHMSRCYKLMDSVLLTLGSNCRRLRTLVMDGCYKITDEGLCRVAEGCRDLEKINLSRCSHHVTDRGVVAIAENCPQLREVILGYLSEVTDTSCVRLCELCPHLEIVTLMFSGVSEQGVRALKKLRKLKIIDISSLPGIAPADVATLTQFCPDLQAMNVSLNPEINDECLLQVIKYGRHLHLLQCVSCHITDKFLSEVGCHTSTLRNLDIGWCQSVTDAGVRALSASCPSLRYLGLIRCDAVTADAIEELMAEFPQITYSTFILESKKLIERARREGFMFREDQNNVDMLV